jgi:hypothetical protein
VADDSAVVDRDGVGAVLEARQPLSDRVGFQRRGPLGALGGVEGVVHDRKRLEVILAVRTDPYRPPLAIGERERQGARRYPLRSDGREGVAHDAEHSVEHVG